MERDSKKIGIVIRSEKWGESDRMLTILSPDGMTRARVYGARSGKHSLKIPVYTEGTFSLEASRQGAPKVKDADVLSYHEYILEDYGRQMTAAFFSELVITSLSSDPQVHLLYCHAIDALESEDREKVAVVYIVQFLSLQGLTGDWRTCPSCGREYREGEVLGFSSLDSVACCSDCDNMQGSLPLPPNARKYLARCQELPFTEALVLSVSDAQRRRIFRYLLRTLRLSYPGKLRTLESVFDDMERN